MTTDAATLDRPTISKSKFPPLRQQIQESGLLKRRPWSYVLMISLNLLLIAGVATAMVFVGPSWWQLLLAVPAAILSGRTGFLGHDAGHQQISARHGVNRLMGLLHGNLLLGMSYGWWNSKHNKHHANPNHDDKDPDVKLGVLAWSKDQARTRRGRLAIWWTTIQGYMFFPLLLLEGFNLKVSSIRDLGHRAPRERAVEIVLLSVHLVGYAGFLLLVMSPLQALVFAVVHHMVLGLHLGMAFAPNHKGMPAPRPGERWDHLHKQVLTSRNVHGGVVTDWILGGLNYQIEHHLFPSMPRANLRHAVSIVRSYCAEIELPYVATTLVDSYRQAIRHMHEVGEPLRLDMP